MLRVDVNEATGSYSQPILALITTQVETGDENMEHQLGEYTLKREEMEYSTYSIAKECYNPHRMMMVWVLRKNGHIMLTTRTKEDMILEMMIYTADAMDE